jgi:hypothetical protein
MARLRMTNADYVAIAVAPALIMALVGSLVFFLIEVLYVGNYTGRLNYVFALFVFATVLIARIAIEFGGEHAMKYGLALGGITFLALERFIEHPGPFSPLINATLLAVVWWCAHQLTWDCTLIDDSEDSSGEGLLQRVGFDEGPAAESATQQTKVPKDGELPEKAGGNELFEDDKPRPWWRKVISAGRGPHTPGLWVLYFSLAALPLFGIGQQWIPAGEIGRRRYAFSLLAVYVFAALSLLVTTSFLGLRRYLRQRRIEMPPAMAATWVGLGLALIVAIMFAAAVLPRPAAEYALAQPRWRASSPGGLKSSEVSGGEEGADNHNPQSSVVSDDAHTPPGSAVDNQRHAETAAADGEQQDAAEQASKREGQGENSDRSDGQDGGESEQSARGEPNGEKGSESEENSLESGPSTDRPPATPGESPGKQGEPRDQAQGAPTEPGGKSPLMNHAETAPEAVPPDSPEQPFELKLPEFLSMSMGSLLKWIVWIVGALVLLVLMAKHWERIQRAIADLWAALFGRKPAPGAGEPAAAVAARRRRTFSDFHDPFAGGRRPGSPVELVKYTFEAFEAWAGDRGCERTPDRTPHELVAQSVSAESPMYAEARRMAVLYGEAAYGSRRVPPESVEGLRELWRMMRASAASPRE